MPTTTDPDVGSSPRTRGTVTKFQCRLDVARFIPTHAGNGGRSPTSGRRPSVHPHARGERRQHQGRVVRDRGSSPRTRGTGGDSRPHFVEPRFIPTHAGNGRLPAWFTGRLTVHPHARGERSSRAVASTAPAGSSPRTRGTVARRPRARVAARFIPTHAGNGVGGRLDRCEQTVHPHARGERVDVGAAQYPAHGSSPRTRGTGEGQALRSPQRRFIPTHAGNGSGS